MKKWIAERYAWHALTLPCRSIADLTAFEHAAHIEACLSRGRHLVYFVTPKGVLEVGWNHAAN